MKNIILKKIQKMQRLKTILFQRFFKTPLLPRYATDQISEFGTRNGDHKSNVRLRKSRNTAAHRPVVTNEIKRPIYKGLKSK